MKRAFTLIELLVVIGIIGILAGILIATSSSGLDSARAAKCLSNLKSLATVWGGERAGSQEHIKMKHKLNGGVQASYSEARGWISSDTQGLYPDEGQSKSHQTFSSIGFMETGFDKGQYAITNGWMYGAIGHDTSVYVCPMHRKKMAGKGQPLWSYFMNAAFGWDAAQGNYTYTDSSSGRLLKEFLTNADRLLIFAEIPFTGPGDWFPDGGSGNTDSDAILQYDGCNKASTACTTAAMNGKENIGGNHRNGKYLYAHVAFADGHTERLRVDGLSAADLKELTTWLCEAKSVSRIGNKYEKLDD